MILSKILCKWKQYSAVGLFLYQDSVFLNNETNPVKDELKK